MFSPERISETNLKTEPFSPPQIEAFMDCFADKEGQWRLFSKRDPYFVAQQEMFSLRFLPRESEQSFQEKLEELRKCLNLTSQQIVERFSSGGDRERLVAETGNKFRERKNYFMNLEAKLEEGKNLSLEQIYQESKSKIPFEIWSSMYLFGLWEYYSGRAREEVEELTNRPGEISLPITAESFLPQKSFYSWYIQKPENLEWKMAPWLSRNLEGRMLVHSLSESSLKLQIFLGNLGDFLATNYVSFSEDLVFFPRPKLFQNDSENWALFFDLKEIKKSGLPLWSQGELLASEEAEVRILVPIDFSLCLGAFPIKLIEKLGWEERRVFVYPNQKLLAVPEEFKNAREVVEMLKSCFTKD